MKYYCKILPLFCLCFSLTLGCNTGTLKTEAVTGIVTYDDKPLAGASVLFTPKQAGAGEPSYAMTNDKGEYVLQTRLGEAGAGTTPGEYIVTVTKSESGSTSTYVSPTDSSSAASTGPVVKPKSAIPEVYGKADTSPLSATVAKGSNKIDFVLVSQP